MHLSRAITLLLSLVLSGTASLAAAADPDQFSAGVTGIDPAANGASPAASHAPAIAAPSAENTIPSAGSAAPANSAAPVTSVSTPSASELQATPIVGGAAFKLNPPPADRNLGPNDLALDGLSMDDIDLWNRIRKGFAIPDLDNQLVANQTAWYAARPDYIQRTTTRASRYLYHVVEELEKRNMPTELAL